MQALLIIRGFKLKLFLSMVSIIRRDRSGRSLWCAGSRRDPDCEQRAAGRAVGQAALHPRMGRSVAARFGDACCRRAAGRLVAVAMAATEMSRDRAMRRDLDSSVEMINDCAI